MIGRLRPASVPAALAATLILASCSGPAPADAPPEPGDEAVARVGGDTVWISDVEREAVAQGLITEGEPLEPSAPEFRRLLEEVIDQKLLAQEAERRDLADDPAVRRRLQAAREQVLGDVLVERTVDGAVSDEDVRRLYDEFRRGERGREVVRLRQITSASEAEATAIRRELEGGADFEALALDRSTDEATRYKGGELGEIDPAAAPEPLARALSDARAGTLIGPLPVEGGFAVLRVDARRAEPVRSLEQLRPQIVRFLSFDEVRKLLQRLRGEAEIEMLTGPTESLPQPREPASAPASKMAP